MSEITIAIDGYSSCGKSTLAKEIAAKLNYIYVDSGAMYRAVTLHLMNKGLIKDGHFIEEQVIEEMKKITIGFHHNPSEKRSETLLNGVNVEQEIRNPRITKRVSAVSAISKVREKLVAIQQEMGKEGGVVMDGRDIGTVVFPNAEIKLFMTASNETRAQRRYDELIAKGEKISLTEVKKGLERRDYLDMNRSISPLKKAADAIEIDNTELDREQQLDVALQLISEKIKEQSSLA
ncbi:MAG: (d)CMP kinase [Flavobacteriales bacterium]|nr:(d)CMP kinase [Flavobacteriales bacterium]